jgi:hypothetical protein
MPDEPASKITNDEPNAHQNEAEVPAPIPISRGDQNTDQNPPNTNPRSYKPKHDCFDWVNLGVLVLTFLAAGGAAFEAKRLADGTDMLVRDAENTAERQLRAYIGIQTQGLGIICPDCDDPNRPASKKMLPENRVTFFLKNFGVTPGYHPTICPGIVPVPLGANLTRRYVDGEFVKCDAVANPVIIPTIWPGESRPYAVPFFKTEIDALIGTRQRRNDAFFYARVSYSDIFREPHNSYFCFQYFHQTDPLMDGFIGCGSTYVTDD